MSDSETESPPTASGDSGYGVLVLAVIAAVVAGTIVAALVFGVAGVGTGDSGANVDGTVAVVAIEGPISEPIGANLENELRDIRANDSIDAVVLKMDTPGGAPASAERMFMSVQRTSQEMPVLASVQGMSASAGYYLMLPAEDIYALPTSQVGSVGLAASAPRVTAPQRGPSGPDKRGSNTIQTWSQLETVGDIFIDTVMEKRGDRIELSREEVSTAKVFTGVNSVQNGYADEIGSIDDAVADAADRAGLEDYRIVERDVTPELGFPILAQTDYGIVAIQDENPSLADVEPLRYPMVHRPAVPHISELDAVATSEIEAQLEELAEEESDGDQP
jgi:protease-4